MLARFRVLLPFELTIPLSSKLRPHEYEEPPYSIRIHPPSRAAIDRAEISIAKTPLMEIAKSIVPASDATPGSTLVDGLATIEANLFQADFIKTTFDRRLESLSQQDFDQGDPSINLLFGVLNNWINRYKYLTRSTRIRPVNPEDTFWALQFLTDDEQPVPQDPDLFRWRTSGRKTSYVDVLDEVIWDHVGATSTKFKPTSWEVLLLDAPALLPEVGPAIVLAYAALEAFIDLCLDKLAPLAEIPPSLWEWITTRDNYWLQPRTDEQLSVLLFSLTGKSLKDDLTLWELFKNLRSARHSYVHTGQAAIGNERVGLERATNLVIGAAQIVSWIEALLPSELRRPDLGVKRTIQIFSTIPLVSGKPASLSDDIGTKLSEPPKTSNASAELPSSTD